MMKFEWDEEKRLSNKRKHRADFLDALHIFEGGIIEREDRRRDYGEIRMNAVGEYQGRVFHVSYTWRGQNRRLISARRANTHDQTTYYNRYPGTGEKKEG